MMRRRRWTAIGGALLGATALTGVAHASAPVHTNAEFVRRAGHQLKIGGKEFRFAGANNYYLPYKSQFMVDDVLAAAQAQGLTVMRTWGAFDVGNADGSNSVGSSDGRADGSVYFHYWDGVGPAFNDGPNGLAHLDYVVYRAGQLGIRLVIPLVNNWSNFGGMDQYVRWAGGQYHDQFYTDPTIRAWFKDWASHLLNHVNTYTGVAYKDDPAIMMWDLANEPRCKGSGDYPRSATCTTATLTKWADEMSRFVKSIDRDHLVEAGDEGFHCDPSSSDYLENCSEGVDTVALAQLPKIDVASFHLYVEGWGKSVPWGTSWIERHVADALAIDKPAVLGEFGVQDQTLRNADYKQWADTMFAVGGAGSLVWMLAGQQDNHTPYPDYDGFTVYCPTAVCTTMSHFAAMMTARQTLTFAPVADDDSAVTMSSTPVSIPVVRNDVAYGATIVPTSIDLDPTASGQQLSVSLASGTLQANADGSVSFAPASGFAGQVSAGYVVADSLGRTSNVASLLITVKPDPAAALILASFETSTQGWAPLSGPGAGNTVQTTSFATQGTHALQVNATGGDWFGAQFPVPVDLSHKTHLKWDISTLPATSQQLALQIGDSWTWCEGGNWAWLNAGTTTTMDVDLNSLSCGAIDRSQVHAMYVFMGNGGAGTIYIDNVRAE